MFATIPRISNISITDPYLRFISPKMVSILKYCYGSLTHIPIHTTFREFGAVSRAIGVGGPPFLPVPRHGEGSRRTHYIVNDGNILSVMKPFGFDHIHFTVRDLDEAVGFYGKLGFVLVGQMEHGGESAQMASPGGLKIDLHLARATENPGYNHFAVAVEGLDAVVAELERQGIRVDGPIEVRATGRRLATVRDPSGFLVQLVEKK
jgi:catechol 2,3-dioxygenase-like lactoylglutathione lyase family enzyme